MDGKRILRLNRIKEVLNLQGRQGSWLAEQVGVTSKTVSFWCSNTSQPHLETLYQIAEILGVKPADLLGDGEEIKK